jgi:acetyl-CoA carboxylase biotin carboxyl carrier protein
MNNKEIHELIKMLDKSEVAEFKLKQGDFSITIRSKDFFKGKGQQLVSMMPSNAGSSPAAAPAPVSSNAPVSTEAQSAATEENSSSDDSKYIVFKSPMVGTFYRKPSPDKDVFVKVGDRINKGDVVAVIEAMKLFNEIESEISGTIVKVLIDDQTPVEYDQALYLIDPA